MPRFTRHHELTAVMRVDGGFDIEECGRAMQAYCRDVVLIQNSYGLNGVAKRLRSLVSGSSFDRLRVTVRGCCTRQSGSCAPEFRASRPLIGEINQRHEIPAGETGARCWSRLHWPRPTTLAIPSVREPLMRAAGRVLVVNEPVAPADVIVLAPDSGGAGALQAADLVHDGIATRVRSLPTLRAGRSRVHPPGAALRGSRGKADPAVGMARCDRCRKNSER